MHHPTLCAVAVALLSALPGGQASLYPKSSAVLQVDGKSYERLIAKSNYTSVSRPLVFVPSVHTLMLCLSDRRVLRPLVRPLQEPPAGL